jgi:hypothetical protein
MIEVTVNDVPDYFPPTRFRVLVDGNPVTGYYTKRGNAENAAMGLALLEARNCRSSENVRLDMGRPGLVFLVTCSEVPDA